MSFLSPTNKLNDLHLQSDIFEIKSDITSENEYEEADKTINEEDDEEEEEEEEEEKQEESQIDPPQHISRKRNYIDSTATPMVITPLGSNNNSNSFSNYSKLSSISNSDSTPCPPQPKRKKLKFKQESSRNILHLNYAKKKIVENNKPLIYQDQPDSDEELEDLNNTMSRKLESTPISQSTPASSRASTPPITNNNFNNISEEYGQSINGYKFVKHNTTSKSKTNLYNYNYETPIDNFKNQCHTHYTQLRDAYIRNDYEIIGELPVTSAGLMNENESGIHVGDKRIINETNQLRVDYLEDSRLPFIPPYFYQNNLPKNLQLKLVSKYNLRTFYNLILEDNESLIEFLKIERIKWHPDKWIKFEHIEIIQLLSQTINELINDIKREQ
ncbi:unnamed protein product [Candida verbasci]|uniref:Uncharacterized protein n=1 Tax=Candida verbasci TaxID=1227364 RepID=A0A9W4TSE0_9ASCO|nr:unnamed protein product [Candida verbasci]